MIDVRIGRHGDEFYATDVATQEVVAQGSLQYVVYCMSYVDLDGKQQYNIVEREGVVL